MAFGRIARSTAMIRLRLVFWVYHCASCVFADGTGRDEGRSRVNEQFFQSFHVQESVTCIITRWCLAHLRTHINYKMHSRMDRNSKICVEFIIALPVSSGVKQFHT